MCAHLESVCVCTCTLCVCTCKHACVRANAKHVYMRVGTHVYVCGPVACYVCAHVCMHVHVGTQVGLRALTSERLLCSCSGSLLTCTV